MFVYDYIIREYIGVTIIKIFDLLFRTILESKILIFIYKSISLSFKLLALEN